MANQNAPFNGITVPSVNPTVVNKETEMNNAQPVAPLRATVNGVTVEAYSVTVLLALVEELKATYPVVATVAAGAPGKEIVAVRPETAILGKVLRYADKKLSPVECYVRNEGTTKVMSMTATTVSGVAAAAAYTMEKGLSLSERINARVNARKAALAAAQAK